MYHFNMKSQSWEIYTKLSKITKNCTSTWNCKGLRKSAWDYTNLLGIAQICARFHKSAQDYMKLCEITQNCTELSNSARNCANLCEFAQISVIFCGSARDYADLREIKQKCTNLRKITWVCLRLPESVQDYRTYPNSRHSLSLSLRHRLRLRHNFDHHY